MPLLDPHPHYPSMIHVISFLLAWSFAAPVFQAPRAYDAPWTSGPMVIDGSLDEPSWSQAPWTRDFVDILGDDAPSPSLRTRAKILWDDTYLYVGAEMEEPHLWATLLEQDAIIYQDDDFEVFLDPDGDGLEYFEVEVNAFGSVLDLFMNKPYNKGGSAALDWNLPGLRTGVLTDGTVNVPADLDVGWAVELAIPWRELVPPGASPAPVSPTSASAPRRPGDPPQPGDTWRINFSRVDWPLSISEGIYRKRAYPSREHPHPESNWVWSPQETINMHIPERWGFVRFVKGSGQSLESSFR